MRRPRARYPIRNGLLFETAGKEKAGSGENRRQASRRNARRGRSRRVRARARGAGREQGRPPARGTRRRRHHRDRREPGPVDAGTGVVRGRAGQSRIVRRARECRAAICRRADGRRPPAARRGHRERHRHQAFGARVARVVRPVAAPGRQGGVRPARAAVRRAVRALGAGVGGGRKAECRAARGRRHDRGDRQADRGLRIADRGHPARDFTADARGAARSRVGDRFRRRRRAPARQCAGRRPPGRAGTAVAGGNQARRRARRGIEERPRRGRGRVAAVARNPAVDQTTARRSRIARSNLRWRSSFRRRRGSRRRPSAAPAKAAGRGAGGERARRARAGNAEVVRRDGRIAGAPARPARRCHARATR